MSKKNREVVVNGVEIEVPAEVTIEGAEVSDEELEGVDPQIDEELLEDDQEGDMDEEAAQEETEEALGDTTSAEDNEEEAQHVFDWKAARDKLKVAHESTGWSVEEIDKRYLIDALRERFNNKERTPELYHAIQTL